MLNSNFDICFLEKKMRSILLYVLFKFSPAVPSPMKFDWLRLFEAEYTSLIEIFGQPDSSKGSSLNAAVYIQIRLN